MQTDIIIVGLGHAGCEAALASARMGLKTIAICINLDTIAFMSCNPSIGGPAKGHIVREIDALGGEMAKNIDATYIHIRLLNTSKGPAVRALRGQADKKAYHNRMKLVLESEQNIILKQGIVEEIIIKNSEFKGVRLQTGEIFFGGALVLTTGTFLNGLIHIGEKSYPAGRQSEFPSVKLAYNLEELGFSMGRLKTGTCPRLNGRTINYEKCIKQSPSSFPLKFSFFSKSEFKYKQIPCWLTHTNEKTHKIIRENLNRSPLYSGKIEGRGPRYCPSIEDKVFRFSDKNTHQIFLEPEGIDTLEIYPQGISTSLPIDVQNEIVKSIEGLENVEILRPGYAIEYDFIYPEQLKPTLESKKIKGIFLAGQINGTSGYEEAAGQGLIAGINAVSLLRGHSPLILTRAEAYIGVLIDDLVTKGTLEPYRMFTSRAEYRLNLRYDNADFRLAEMGNKYKLISDEQLYIIKDKEEKVRKTIEKLKTFHVKHENSRIFNDKIILSESQSLYKLLKRPELTFLDIEDYLSLEYNLSEEMKEKVETEVKYEGYIKKQKMQIQEFLKLENLKIPSDLDFMNIPHISKEGREKLTKIKPVSIGQARRISGVSPADISVLLYYLKKKI